MEFGSLRRLTLWGVVLTLIADLSVSAFWMMLTLSNNFGISNGGAFFNSPLMPIFQSLNSLANIAFSICLAGYLYAVHKDLNEMYRSLDYARYGLLQSAADKTVAPQ